MKAKKTKDKVWEKVFSKSHKVNLSYMSKRAYDFIIKTWKEGGVDFTELGNQNVLVTLKGSEYRVSESL